MAAFFEISTWIWIAGAFLGVKFIFKYLAWLYYDKEKTLRENVERVRNYLSQHSYFEIIRGVLARLYDRLSNIFQRKIRFLYLFLLFFFLNLVSLWLGRYVIGINPAELKTLLLSLGGLITGSLLISVDTIGETMGLGRSLVSIFQLSILDLCSFLFTMGIIWMASRSKSFILLLFELITDISILALFFMLVFQGLYYWLVKDIFLSLFGSFFLTFGIGMFFWLSYLIFRYMGHPDSARMKIEDRFRPLSRILAWLVVAFIIMGIIGPFTFFTSFPTSLLDVTLPKLFLGIFILIIMIWVLISRRAEEKANSVIKFGLITAFTTLLLGGVYYSIGYLRLLPQFYSVLSSTLTSRFVLILVFSSAFPTLAHLMAIIPAVMAKATPGWLQRFINRHLNALFKNEKEVLNQLGNAFGGIGALITAIIKLIWI